jgi:uncharacterized NAD(P)/FAD-binding protein YdhS
MLPQVHRGSGGPADAIWLPALSDTGDPVRLPELIWQVRAAMASRPNHWQDVVDAVRPHIPDLWRRLPDRDKRLFVRHVARYWEVHRHRMPPATARRITELRCTGRLSVLRGQVTGVSATPGPERLRIRVTTDGSVTNLTAGWLINATGPGTDLARTADPLLRDLLSQGLARPDPLRLGLDATGDGTVLCAGSAMRRPRSRRSATRRPPWPAGSSRRRGPGSSPGVRPKSPGGPLCLAPPDVPTVAPLEL